MDNKKGPFYLTLRRETIIESIKNNNNNYRVLFFDNYNKIVDYCIKYNICPDNIGSYGKILENTEINLLSNGEIYTKTI